MPTKTRATPHTPPAARSARERARARQWVPIRTLHEGHRAKVCAHLLALDDDARTLRFGHAVSDEHLRRYAGQLDFRRDRLFGTFDRRLDLLTLGHLALDLDKGTAEFGISVLPRARGRGLGTQLFEYAVTHARNLAVHTLYVHLARDNTPMLAIVQRAGATIDFEGREATAQLPLPAETLGSKIEELIGRQAANLDFRVKRQALRLDPLPAGKPPLG